MKKNNTCGIYFRVFFVPGSIVGVLIWVLREVYGYVLVGKGGGGGEGRAQIVYISLPTVPQTGSRTQQLCIIVER